MKYVQVALISAVLIYGGISDYKRREIPNTVPIVIVIVACLFDFSFWQCIIGSVVPATVFYVAAKLTKSEMPGGDFKLLCALGFACGLLELVGIILLAGLGAVIVGIIEHQPIKRHIPLCSYAAPSYLLLQSLLLCAKGVMKM